MPNSVIEATEQQAISYMRQSDWFDPADHPGAEVTIVGVGGLGSPTALALAKLGIPKLTLVDYDTVESHNLPNQMFPLDSRGSYKVDAAAAMLEAFAPTEVVTLTYKIGERDPDKPRGIVISAPDSMEARQNVWKMCKLNPYCERIVDLRMGGQALLVYSVDPRDPDDIEYYEGTMGYTDAEARPTPCTAAAVIDVGFMAASLATRAVRKHYAGESVERMIFVDQSAFIIGKE